MRKTGLILTVVMLFTLILTGCGAKNVDASKITTSTLTVLKGGKIDAVFVEDFSQSYYNQSELDTMIKEEVEEFNKNSGSESIKYITSIVANNIAKVQLDFDNADIYSEYEGEYFYNGTVKDAVANGYSFDYELKSASDESSTIDGTKILELGDYGVVITAEPLHVSVPGKVMYVSVDASIVSENEVDTYENPGETVILYK
ncbi:MAG: hypothetical protein MJ119_02570 [Lachnospiraceae bacterium]|nr:hypothetical protein [Lachnospiraceae bacterium]